ncbi:MAG: hydantoinase/oxoprolinase family protein [Pseudomonadota bacterium]
MPVPDLSAAVDIGGTFTDTVIACADGGVLATSKVLTTVKDPADGALSGVMTALKDIDRSLADVAGFVHGTTLATNALIEKRGARVATVATEGFGDILEIAYERRHSQYDINIEKPDYLVPRRRSFAIRERVTVGGDVLVPLEEAQLPTLLENLDQCEAEAVAICLLHSYANPTHERRLANLIATARPEMAISISSEVSPEAREFDRMCTTVANAYVQPLMQGYLRSLSSLFQDKGLGCPILMMTASGGITTVETAMRLPVRLVESGPAGGAILAGRVARACGADQVVSLDVGGTTAKLCLIDDGRPQMARQFEIARAARFVKGSGMPVRIPVVEMIEIGAGGGSIAAVDQLGRLSVGPQSAGSDPGPVAFGKGGRDPTVTDADVLQGLVDAGRFAEGRLFIDSGAARFSLQQKIGEPLGLESVAAARGVSAIVDENMASAARVHAVESGKDLTKRTMIAFGGNGPLHATRVAEKAGISQIIIPVDPGVGSAVGFLNAPLSFEMVRSRYMTLDRLDFAVLKSTFDQMIREAEGFVRLGDKVSALIRQRSAFMRYKGQGHEIEVRLPDRDLKKDDLGELINAFEDEYRRQFSRPVPGMVIEVMNWGLSVSTPEKAPERSAEPVSRAKPVPQEHREIRIAAERVSAECHRREELDSGDLVQGPALITEPQTTTLVGPGWTAVVDDAGNLHLCRRGRA